MENILDFFLKPFKKIIRFYNRRSFYKLLEQGVLSVYLNTKHGKIHYLHYNPEDKEDVILLLHGLGGSYKTFSELIIPLSQRFCVYVMELPGHGLSKLPSDKKFLLFENYMDVLKTFIEKIIAKPFILLGHSFGGWLSLKYATENQWEIRKLILINNSGTASYGYHYTRLKFVINNYKELYNLWKMMWVKVPLYFYLVREDGLKILKSPLITSLIRTVKDKDHIHKEHLQSLFTDCLILWGKHDKLLMDEVPKFLSENLPKHELIYFENSAHFPQNEESEKVLDILLKIDYN